MSRFRRLLLAAASLLLLQPSNVLAYPDTFQGCIDASADGWDDCRRWGHSLEDCDEMFEIMWGLCEQQYAE